MVIHAREAHPMAIIIPRCFTVCPIHWPKLSGYYGQHCITHNWRALCKGGICTNFLRWKLSSYFYPQVGRQGFKHVHERPPPSSGGNTHTVFIFQGSKAYIVWRRIGGGVDFHVGLSIFSCLLRKSMGHFFTQKESTWQISVDSD